MLHVCAHYITSIINPFFRKRQQKLNLAAETKDISQSHDEQPAECPNADHEYDEIGQLSASNTATGGHEYEEVCLKPRANKHTDIELTGNAAYGAFQ